MAGSLIGGRVTDKFNHKYKCTEGGLLAAIIGILAMQPGLLVIIYFCIVFIEN